MFGGINYNWASLIKWGSSCIIITINLHELLFMIQVKLIRINLDYLGLATVLLHCSQLIHQHFYFLNFTWEFMNYDRLNKQNQLFLNVYDNRDKPSCYFQRKLSNSRSGPGFRLCQIGKKPQNSNRPPPPTPPPPIVNLRYFLLHCIVSII